jgi:hypothetical protein
MYRYLANTSFDPPTPTKICETFDMATKAMHDCGQPELIQEILAKKIIGPAGQGETEPDALSKRALTCIGLPQ